MKKQISIYKRLTLSFISALIGTFVVPILALIITGSLESEQIGNYAMGGALSFALLCFLFPDLMGKVLFVLTLFQ